MSPWKRPLLCLASCALLGLSFPKPDIGILAWVALIPLVWALRESTPKQGAAYGGLLGVTLTVITLYYIGIFGYLPLILLAVYQGVFFALLGLAWPIFLRKGGVTGVLGTAAAWAGLEWVRSLGPLGHTVGALGYTQHALLSVAQVARIGSVYAVSFVIVIVNVGIAEAIREAREKREGTSGARQVLSSPRIVSGGLLLLTLAYGFVVLALGGRDHSPVLRAAAIQPNPTLSFYSTTRAEERADFRRHVQMTIGLSGWEPDFIAWPESAIQGSLFSTDDRPFDVAQGGEPVDPPETFAEVVRAARESGADLLVGSTERETMPDSHLVGNYNRAWLISRQGQIVGYYDKVNLAIFGEYVPFRHSLGFILNRYPIRSFDYTPGKEIAPLEADNYTVGVAICFEELKPGITRKECGAGADVLAIITNDGWFKRTSAAEQLAYICVFRAIENGAPVVRAAKTGISCIIDKYGRVLDRSAVFVEGSVKAPVRLRRGVTPYQVLGDTFAILCLIGAAVGLRRPVWESRV